MDQPTASCSAGTFRGVHEADVDVWRGIRYAEPPVGEHRWRRPRPANPVDTDAIEFGPVAPQTRIPFIALGADARMDEDCLFLNVWRPASPSDAPRPVMVWLHGGAYALGSGSQPLYDAAVFAARQQTVVVTINYRLGALGFLDLTSFANTDTPFDSNLALRDALLALEWVRMNIAGFGGDPDRVTVAGESAGAGLVTALLAAPAAQGLVHRAIAQSSPVSSMYGLERAAAVADLFLTEVGIPAPRVADVRTLSVDHIVRATKAVYEAVPNSSPGVLAFAPTIDGDVLPESPISTARNGRTLPIPLLIGTNRDEASLFAKMSSPIMPVDRVRIMRMFNDLGAALPDIDLPSVPEVEAFYSRVPRRQRGLAVARDIGFRLPTVWFADAHGEVAPVWLYRFDHATPLLRLIGLRAGHAMELPYVWGNFTGPEANFFKLGGRRIATAISQRMQDRWGSFIRGESPNTNGAVDWQPSRQQDRRTLVIAPNERLDTDLDRDELELWGPDNIIAFP